MLQKQLIEKTKIIRELQNNKQEDISNDNISILEKKICNLENIISNLQKNLIEKNNEIQRLNSNTNTFTRIPIEIEDNEKDNEKDNNKKKLKSDPEIFVDIDE